MDAGRDEGFTDYVRERRSHLLATAYLLCGDRRAAEDLVRHALGKLYVAWPRVRRTGSEDGYVRQVLVTARLAAPTPDHQDELVTTLAALTPGQRRVVVLRHWLGLTVEEVALELEMSSGAVESQTPAGMAGRDLQDRMTESTAWTGLAPIDPQADLRRGRQQLRRWVRRRRLSMAAGGALALVVVIGVLALVDRSGSLEPAISPPPIHTRPPPATEQLASWFADSVDPQRRHLTTTASEGGSKRTGIQATMIWRQGAGSGRVSLSLTPPGHYDTAGAKATSTRCQVVGRRLADGPPYQCRWITEAGRRVLTGTADVAGVRSYFASYVRPDRHLVLAAVEGDRRQAGSAPVRDIAVTLDDVVAAVTDPAVPMP